MIICVLLSTHAQLLRYKVSHRLEHGLKSVYDTVAHTKLARWVLDVDPFRKGTEVSTCALFI